MTGNIFINYRREDDPGSTGWLREHLEEAFSSEQLFMDVDSIEPGLDFVRVLEEQVDKCDVVLAVIGPRWLDARDKAGNRRLDNPDDFVRLEIESSLKLGEQIIPVLVNNAEMPTADVLPESLRPLVRRNAVRLTHERFRADAQGVIRALQKALEAAEHSRQALEVAENSAQTLEMTESVQVRKSFPLWSIILMVVVSVIAILTFAVWTAPNHSAATSIDPNDPRSHKGDLITPSGSSDPGVVVVPPFGVSTNPNR